MCPEVELLDHMVTLILDFLMNLHAVFLSGYYKEFLILALLTFQAGEF